MSNFEDPNTKTPVCRKRRFKFVSSVVGFGMVSSTVVVLLAGFGLMITTGITEVFVDSMIGISIAVSLAYLTGSVIDYNGGIMGAVGNSKRDPNAR